MVALMKPDNQIVDTIIQGDCLEVLRTLDACSVDACVVDPPYGLGEVKDIAGLLQAWIRDEDDSRYLGKSGFMGKEWDAGVPGPRYWREVLRVMKPGAHILCFASTRTVDLMMIALRLAGFQCRDTLMWVYGSGFPKSTDISKKIDRMKGAERKVIGKRTNGNRGGGAKTFDDDSFVWPKEFDITAPSTPEAQRYAGTGTALKPAHEPIILARKPLSEKSIAENVLRWGTGGLNIDACRVGTHDYTQEQWNKKGEARTTGNAYGVHKGSITPLPQGRFPGNLLLSHSLFCTPLGTRKVKGNGTNSPIASIRKNGAMLEGMATHGAVNYNDSEGMEEVQAWECTEDCPIRLLDKQSGVLHARGNKKPSVRGGGMYGHKPFIGDAGPGDQGGASRYFTQFCYTAKASRAERNRGCEALPASQTFDKNTSKQIAHINHTTGQTTYNEYHPSANQNNHPTVKPQALLSWLSKLICPPGGIILDPFGGSGSQAVACINNGFHFILIEQDASYCEIARARVAHAFGEVTP